MLGSQAMDFQVLRIYFDSISIIFNNIGCGIFSTIRDSPQKMRFPHV